MNDSLKGRGMGDGNGVEQGSWRKGLDKGFPLSPRNVNDSCIRHNSGEYSLGLYSFGVKDGNLPRLNGSCPSFTVGSLR